MAAGTRELCTYKGVALMQRPDGTCYAMVPVEPFRYEPVHGLTRRHEMGRFDSPIQAMDSLAAFMKGGCVG